MVLRYLQRQLNTLTDPYELAIVTHAFTWVNSAAKEISFGKLHSMRRENGNTPSARRPNLSPFSSDCLPSFSPTQTTAIRETDPIFPSRDEKKNKKKSGHERER